MTGIYLVRLPYFLTLSTKLKNSHEFGLFICLFIFPMVIFLSVRAQILVKIHELRCNQSGFTMSLGIKNE